MYFFSLILNSFSNFNRKKYVDDYADEGIVTSIDHEMYINPLTGTSSFDSYTFVLVIKHRVLQLDNIVVSIETQSNFTVRKIDPIRNMEMEVMTIVGLAKRSYDYTAAFLAELSKKELHCYICTYDPDEAILKNEVLNCIINGRQ